MTLVRPFLHDRVDIIGDIHGEIEALERLLGRLHVDIARGRAERPLIFVGDLVDRGPDSVAVVELIQHLENEKIAQVVLGNHEHNLLRGEEKEGNGWFVDHADGADCFPGPSGPQLFASRVATSEEKEKIRRFLLSLPVALESRELRVVHADWFPEDIEAAREVGDYSAFDALRRCAATEFDLRGAPDEVAIRNYAVPLPYHHGLACQHAADQNREPIRVLLSGREKPLRTAGDPSEIPVPFLSGKHRFAERARWWREDDDERAVVFGHYWRRLEGRNRGKMDVFEGIDPLAWFGKRRQAFCVDYSVGKRFEARAYGRDLREGALAALRWPERTLLFDTDTERFATRL
jgi:hypothetical protein